MADQTETPTCTRCAGHRRVMRPNVAAGEWATIPCPECASVATPAVPERETLEKLPRYYGMGDQGPWYLIADVEPVVAALLADREALRQQVQQMTEGGYTEKSAAPNQPQEPEPITQPTVCPICAGCGYYWRATRGGGHPNACPRGCPPALVHNHGPEDGPGLACREHREGGRLVGACLTPTISKTGDDVDSAERSAADSWCLPDAPTETIASLRALAVAREREAGELRELITLAYAESFEGPYPGYRLVPDPRLVELREAAARLTPKETTT